MLVGIWALGVGPGVRGPYRAMEAMTETIRIVSQPRDRATQSKDSGKASGGGEVSTSFPTLT